MSVTATHASSLVGRVLTGRFRAICGGLKPALYSELSLQHSMNLTNPWEVVLSRGGARSSGDAIFRGQSRSHVTTSARPLTFRPPPANLQLRRNLILDTDRRRAAACRDCVGVA